LKFCMTATTCGRVQSFGSTCKFVGASWAGACASAEVAEQIKPIVDNAWDQRATAERAMVVISCCCE
jgi:hypothetical protein